MALAFDITQTKLDDSWIVPKYRPDFSAKSENVIDYRYLAELINHGSGMYVRDYLKDGLIYLRVNSISKYTINKDDLVFVENKKYPGRVQAEEFDVIISRTGTIGKAALVTSDFTNCVLSQHITKLAVKDTSKLLPGYLCAYLNTKLGSKSLISLASGSTRLELNHNDLIKLHIPIISFEKQKRIHNKLVGYLNEYYSKINQLSELRQNSDELLQLTYQTNNLRQKGSFEIELSDLGSSWCPSHHLPELTDNLNKINNNYNVIKLGEISKIERGKGTRAAEYFAEGLPFVRTSSLVNFSIEPFTDFYMNPDYKYLLRNINDGDILYSIEGKIGQVAMLTKEYIVAFKNHIQKISLTNIPEGYGKEEFAGWVFLCLSSNLGLILKNKYSLIQSTIPGLSNKLKEFIIPIESKYDPMQKHRFKDYGIKAFNLSKELLVCARNLQGLHQETEAFLN